MPRKNLIKTDLYPYHVTIRCNNKEWFSLALHQIWKICLKAFRHANQRHPIQLQAFVLMNNHYHMLLWTPLLNLDRFMFEFNSYLSKEIRKETHRINRIFGDRYKWCLIDQADYYYAVLRYIYQNPIKAGMTPHCVDYPYSTLHVAYSDYNFPIPIYRIEETLELQNDGFFEKQLDRRDQLSKALARSTFKVPKSSTSRRAF